MEGAGCWLSGVGMSPMTWSLKLLREATRSNNFLLSHAMVSVGVVLGGGVPCWARYSGRGPWTSPAQAQGVRLVPPPVGGGHQDAVP